MPGGGKDLGGFQRLTALKVEQKGAMDLGHGLFCKYSKIVHLT